MYLTDCFMELIAYVAYFKKNVESRQPPYEQVKADIMRLVSQSDTWAKKGLFPQEDYDLARFAVCAWTDEMILGSTWNYTFLWQREQLQRFYYNTTEAGEEVFDRLNALGMHQRSVREVYYLCLALGFKGRFIHPGDDFLLEQVKASNLQILMGSSLGLPTLEKEDLFPDAYPLKGRELKKYRHKFHFSFFTICLVVGPVMIFCVFYAFYWLFLNNIADKAIRLG
jgi:type VI secretion system protein ImpK